MAPNDKSWSGWVVMREDTDEIYRSEADAIFMGKELEKYRGKALRITKVIEERNKYGNGTEENATEKELDQRSNKPGAQGVLHADE